MFDHITIAHNKAQAERIDELCAKLRAYDVHWFLVVENGRVSGRCSDGRTFSDPTINPRGYLHGFTAALTMHGVSYEVRDERA